MTAPGCKLCSTSGLVNWVDEYGKRQWDYCECYDGKILAMKDRENPRQPDILEADDAD